jgi:hypothetical protein
MDGCHFEWLPVAVSRLDVAFVQLEVSMLRAASADEAHVDRGQQTRAERNWS